MGESLIHRSTENGSYGVVMSDGSIKQIVDQDVESPISIQEWDLSLESWGPDESVNDVNPTISKKTTVLFNHVATGTTWDQLPATTEQLEQLEVNSIADVSGIGDLLCNLYLVRGLEHQQWSIL